MNENKAKFESRSKKNSERKILSLSLSLSLKKLRFHWLKLWHRPHLSLRKIHDKFFAKKKLYYRYHCHPYSKHINRFTKYTAIATFAFLVIFNLANVNKSYATSVYSWVQTSWSGGADTSNFPSHPTNQTGWNKFFSKDSSISTTSGISLNSPSSSFVDDTTAEFNAGTHSNTNGYNNKVILLKPLGATASSGWECDSGFVSGGVCAWGYPGRAGSSLAGKYVYYQDLGSTMQWRTTNTDCPSPQCTVAGPEAETYSGYTGKDVLVADNGVSFSGYPARDACKAIGGRLPTIAELVEMYNYKSSYGNNFQSSGYWSATETSSTAAYYVSLSSGYVSSASKSNNAYVRCVR